MTIGERIRQRRELLGLSVDDVAKMLGKHRATVYRYESDEIENLSTVILEPLARVLQTTPAELMGWEDNMRNDPNFVPVSGMVPILGSIPAGVPLLAQQNIEGYMPVTVKNPQEYFSFRVKGNSMVNANIFNGSLVLIHRQSTAENGDIVACRVNGDEATLKRFKCIGETAILLPENPEYQPIIVSCKDFESGYAEIIGVAKQVIMDL